MGRKLGINKIKAGFSIDVDTYNELDNYCNITLINKSRLIDKLIKKFLNENIIINEKK